MENLGKQTALKRPVGSAEMSRNTQNGSKTDCREHLSANLTMGFTDIGFAVSVAPCPRLGKDESMIVAMSKLGKRIHAKAPNGSSARARTDIGVSRTRHNTCQRPLGGKGQLLCH